MIRYIFCLCLLALAGTGLMCCSESFLDEDLKSKYTPETTLQDSLGFEAAIAGLQSVVRAQYTTGEPQGLLCTMQVGTDVAITGQTQGVETPYFNYALMNSQDAGASFFWNWAYQVINNANLIIANIDNPAMKMGTPNRNSIKAEALFFRAYAYNFLTILFGDVPLIEAPLLTPKTDFVRAPMNDVLTLISGDLVFATENLPDVSKVKKPGRVNKAAAQQLLAEVYIRMNKADLAEAQCTAIISSNLFSLTKVRYGTKAGSPGDPFSDMFIFGNQRRYQGNMEAIWVEEQEYNLTGGSNLNADQHRRVWVPFYAGLSDMKVADSLGGRGIGRMRLSDWVLYGLYESNDMRNSKYSIKRVFYYNNPTSAKYGQKVTGLTGSDTLFRITPYTRKWNHMIGTDEFGYSVYKDLIMMRLGETYLLLAEAQLMQNKLTEAAESINEIRDRANATPVSAADITLDFILDERARELVAEENRRTTLMRTKTLVTRTKALNGASVKGLEDKHLLLPVPQSERDLNKDADLGQNTGY